MEPQVGQKYPFGGGAFAWRVLPNGQYGWASPDGRAWDPAGNPIRAGGQARLTTGTGGPVTDPGAGLLQQQNQANSLLQFLGRTPPNKINTYEFNKLPTSSKQLTLAGYEALGYDQGDAEETIQKLLPRQAAGPSRGYVAPMGR
jgi:hypothetical protein